MQITMVIDSGIPKAAANTDRAVASTAFSRMVDISLLPVLLSRRVYKFLMAVFKFIITFFGLSMPQALNSKITSN